MVLLRHRKSGPDVRSHVIPGAVLNAGEDVEAGLKPLVEAVRDLDGFVLGVVGGEHAVDRPLLPGSSEVAVQFHHRDIRLHQVRSVDLYLVIALGAKAQSAKNQENSCPAEVMQVTMSL